MYKIEDVLSPTVHPLKVVQAFYHTLTSLFCLYMPVFASLSGGKVAIYLPLQASASGKVAPVGFKVAPDGDKVAPAGGEEATAGGK
jgi:hypothetical protein